MVVYEIFANHVDKGSREMYGFKRYLESRVESTRKVDIGIDREREKKEILQIYSLGQRLKDIQCWKRSIPALRSYINF